MKLWLIVNYSDCEEHGVAGIYLSEEEATQAYIKNVLLEESTTIKKAKEYCSKYGYQFVLRSPLGNLIKADNMPETLNILPLGSCCKEQQYIILDCTDKNLIGYGGYEIIEVNSGEWFRDWI